MVKEGFAVRLKEAMNDKGLKQVDLVRMAELEGCKLGKSQLSQYLSGKTAPRAATLSFLAKALDVRQEWLEGSDSDVDDAEPRVAVSSKPMEKSEFGQVASKSRFVDESDVDEDEIELDDDRFEGSISSAGQESDEDKGGRTPHAEIRKSSKLEHVLYDVRGPVLDEATRMESAGMHVLKLNIGNPAPFGFRTPDEVVQDMSRQLAECEGYSDSKGLFSARKAIMQYYQLKGLPNVTMDDIYTGNGVSELINMCMSALLDDGDEILIPAPDYPLWTATATLAGGKAVHYLCDEQSNWYPDLDDIRRKVTFRTKAIVIINPNNPTGALYPREVLEEIVEIAREHNLIIFSDEIYDRLIYDGGEHVSIASLAPDLFCVTFSGLSKSHMIAGYRIGWMALSGNKRIAKDYILGLNMLSNMRLCSNVPAQSVVQTALWGHQSVKDHVSPGGRLYEQREYVYNALKDIPGISVVKPEAAFYIFPKLDKKKFGIVNDEQFALDLLREKKVLIVQGTGFNWPDPDHFRIVFLPRRRVLREAMESIADFLQYYHQ